MTNQNLSIMLSETYSDSMLTDFFIKTEKLYDFFGLPFNMLPKKENLKSSYHLKLWSNEKYINKAVSNVTVLCFNNIIPKFIASVSEVNLENFGNMMSELFKVYESETDNEIRYNIKTYINSVWGVIHNPDSLIYSHNVLSVVQCMNMFIHKIQKEFEDSIVNIDFSNIYFRNFEEIKERFELYFSKINKYQLSYETEKSSFLFVRKPKYFMVEKGGDIKVKGIECYTEEGKSHGGIIKL